MKKVIITALSAVLLYAYQKGDVIDKEIAQKLALDKEKVYIVDFFASWCHSCKREIPSLSKLNESLDKQKTEIIGIDVDENTADGKKFQNELKQENKLNFKVIDDPKGEIVKKFNPVAIPAIYIVKNLKVEAVIIGAKDNIDEIIKNNLKETK